MEKLNVNLEERYRLRKFEPKRLVLGTDQFLTYKCHGQIIHKVTLSYSTLMETKRKKWIFQQFDTFTDVHTTKTVKEYTL
jgi:hypothetical protein